MLKADLVRRAFEMHIRPSALIEFVSAVEASIRCLTRGRSGGGCAFRICRTCERWSGNKRQQEQADIQIARKSKKDQGCPPECPEHITEGLVEQTAIVLMERTNASSPLWARVSSAPAWSLWPPARASFSPVPLWPAHASPGLCPSPRLWRAIWPQAWRRLFWPLALERAHASRASQEPAQAPPSLQSE